MIIRSYLIVFSPVEASSESNSCCEVILIGLLLTEYIDQSVWIDWWFWKEVYAWKKLDSYIEYIGGLKSDSSQQHYWYLLKIYQYHCGFNRHFVLSAKMKDMADLIHSGRLLKKTKSRGPCTLPCGTPIQAHWENWWGPGQISNMGPLYI